MRWLVILFVVPLISLLVHSGVAAEQDTAFMAVLSGDEEVPPVATEMSGSVRIRFDDDFTSAAFTLTVNGGIRVQQAHIHCGLPGVNGPVVVFFAGLHLPGWDVDGKWIDHASFTKANIVNPACGSTLTELAQSMRDGKTYANVHTSAHSGGEIRGQIESK